MPQIISLSFNKISMERGKKPQGKLSIKTNININDIKKEKTITKNKDILGFDFTFDIFYEPKFANLSFWGNVLMLVDSEESKQILKEWKNKKISENIKNLLFNTIFMKCNIKALQLEENLNLPAHIPLPRIKQTQKQSYTG